MRYIKIKNEGCVDVGAFMLLGASTKRNDSSKIGFFGSGLKYAIAVLLRNKVGFKIFSGLQEIKVETMPEEFRGQIFNKIVINGVPTTMTQEMGVDWKSWFSVREIYCNAIDEGKEDISVVNEIQQSDDETHFYIELTESMKELLDNWNDYFCNKRNDVLYKDKDMTVYCGGDKALVYRKGVQCYAYKSFEETYHSIFHYDLSWVSINESRVLSGSYELHRRLPQELAKNASVQMIQKIFDGYNKSFELDFYWRDVTFYNENWIEVIGGRQLIPHEFAGSFVGRMEQEKSLILPSKMIHSLANYFKGRVEIAGKSDEYGNHVVVEADKRQLYLIKESLDFLKESGFEVNYPIKVALFNDKNVLGQANSTEIILSVNVFEHGRKKIVETIIEEAFHLESRYKDETRAFQDYLINKFVGLLEQKSGVLL